MKKSVLWYWCCRESEGCLVILGLGFQGLLASWSRAMDFDASGLRCRSAEAAALSRCFTSKCVRNIKIEP